MQTQILSDLAQIEKRASGYNFIRLRIGQPRLGICFAGLDYDVKLVHLPAPAGLVPFHLG